MLEHYRNLNNEFKTVIWASIVIISLVILTIPCFFFSLMEIPQGIALGGAVGILVYLVLGIFNNPDKPKQSMIFTVITIIVRFIIIGGILFLVGWLYYKQGFKAFNIFAVMGGYFVPLIISIILGRKEKADGNS